MMRILSLMLTLGMAACTYPTAGADNPNTPGATGRVIIPGSTSTIAGDAQANYIQQKWGVGGQR